MNEVMEIYETLKQYDAKLSVRQFSREYLEKSETYLFSNRYYERPISKTAAVVLYHNLRSIKETWATLYDETKRPRYKDNYELFNELTQRAQNIVLSE